MLSHSDADIATHLLWHWYAETSETLQKEQDQDSEGVALPPTLLPWISSIDRTDTDEISEDVYNQFRYQDMSQIAHVAAFPKHSYCKPVHSYATPAMPKFTISLATEFNKSIKKDKAD